MQEAGGVSNQGSIKEISMFQYKLGLVSYVILSGTVGWKDTVLRELRNKGFDAESIQKVDAIIVYNTTKKEVKGALFSVGIDGGKYTEIKGEYIFSVKEEGAGGQLVVEVKKALPKLTSRERRVLELRFGLSGGHPMTLEEVGYDLNVTRERIRQIEAKAFGGLRRFRRDCGGQPISLPWDIDEILKGNILFPYYKEKRRIRRKSKEAGCRNIGDNGEVLSASKEVCHEHKGD